MFDYQKFENDVLQQMKSVMDKWVRENSNLYIFSLDCAREMDSIGVIANTDRYLTEQSRPDSEDYWYYKYCEDEWELFDTFDNVSMNMRDYLAVNKERFVNSERHEFTKAFDEHCDKMIECCINALIKFKESIKQADLDIILTFNIREYFDGEERLEYFKRINGVNAVAEYSEHIDEFA